MNYLKLYESFGDGFKELDRNEWRDFNSKLIDFDMVNLNRFPKEIKPEIHKTIPKAKKDSLTQNVVSYIIIYLSFPSGEVPLFIYQHDDEYYGIYTQLTKKKDYRLKCDQIEGLLKGIEFLKGAWEPEPPKIEKKSTRR